MARTISTTMSGILEDLELENQSFVNIRRIAELAEKYEVASAPYLIASRLKKAGWLLPTDQRGVWEFAPASLAGAYSKNDPLGPVKAYMSLNPDDRCYLCLQTAAWALGLADRIPEHNQLAFSSQPKHSTAGSIYTFVYSPAIDLTNAKGVPCLAPESIIVQIASKPSVINSWESAMEWIPDVVYEINTDELLRELKDRPDSVKKRTGYLLQGMFPTAAEAILATITSNAKIRYGPRARSIRNDEKWMISDTILPFSPKELEKVK